MEINKSTIETANSNEAIYIKKHRSIFAIKPGTILYMEKMNRQIIVHLTEGDEICFYGKYDLIMPLLDERFVHPHESYVINMQQIFRLGRCEAVMFGGDKIKMGKRCFGNLRQAYDKYITDNFKNRIMG